MTNFEKWRLYTEGLVSPDNYINFGFYSLIAACLQRRVWIGPDHAPLYPNLYVILVGEPGVGKGLVVKQINKVLTHHKLQQDNTDQVKLFSKLSNLDRQVAEEVLKEDFKNAQEAEYGEKVNDKTLKMIDKPLLFPMAADSTTYEALVRALAKSIRRKNVLKYDDEKKQEVSKIYTHSSLTFCLEEISSLLRRKTEDVVHFIIQTYDCGDYTYDTKNNGRDRIKNCCVNFLGGTTPGFMQKTFDDQLLTEGFASRVFFIYAARNRKTTLWIPDLTQEQQDAYNDILNHIKELSSLYGRVRMDSETSEFLEQWWIDSQKSRSNVSYKLNPYYARKNIHVIKLAMAIHFAESTEMHIRKESFEKAIQLLKVEEKKMHYALGLESGNPLAIPTKKILKYLETLGHKTKKELLAEFWNDLPRGLNDLDEILSYLWTVGKIEKFPIPESESCKWGTPELDNGVDLSELIS